MASLIAELAGYSGRLRFDETKPDGAPHKTVDGTRGRVLMNWTPGRDFVQGVKETIEWYREKYVRL